MSSNDAHNDRALDMILNEDGSPRMWVTMIFALATAIGLLILGFAVGQSMEPRGNDQYPDAVDVPVKKGIVR